MPRGKVKKLDAGVKTTIWLPESLDTRVRLRLYSEVEGRVPYGALSGLMAELLNNWLTKESGNERG